MNSEDNGRQGEAYRRFRSVLHIAMGAIYLALGFVVISVKHFGFVQLNLPVVAYALGGLMILYGGFRLWRGFASLRQRPSRY